MSLPSDPSSGDDIVQDNVAAIIREAITQGTYNFAEHAHSHDICGPELEQALGHYLDGIAHVVADAYEFGAGLWRATHFDWVEDP